LKVTQWYPEGDSFLVSAIMDLPYPGYIWVISGSSPYLEAFQPKPNVY